MADHPGKHLLTPGELLKNKARRGRPEHVP
jgi:hypothetical protein